MNANAFFSALLTISIIVVNVLAFRTYFYGSTSLDDVLAFTAFTGSILIVHWIVSLPNPGGKSYYTERKKKYKKK
ncbi:hypothetical protein TI03_01170 [Achromatium sp. WMS1]|nr:hypothetical protein TI03_01170 [Achromatium sp. WMS1]